MTNQQYCYRNESTILVIGTLQECENARIWHGYSGRFIEKYNTPLETVQEKTSIQNRSIETNKSNAETIGGENTSRQCYITKHYAAGYYLTHLIEKVPVAGREGLFIHKVISNGNIGNIVPCNRYSEKGLIKAHYDNMATDKN